MMYTKNNYVHNYLFFILCTEFHTVRRQIIFCRRCPHHVEGPANQTRKMHVGRTEDENLQLLKTWGMT